MQVIGDNTYRLVGLDTCIYSEIARNRNGARDGFLAMFADGRHVPVFSTYSLFELRRRPEIYDQFLELFDVLPCAVLKNDSQLHEAEVEVYPDPSGVDPIVLGFSVLNRSKGTNLRNLMEVVFKQPDTLQRERDWPRLKQEILDGWLELKPNFQPAGKHFKPSDGLEFVELVSLQQAMVRDLSWARRQLSAGTVIDTHAFPSLRMTAWTVFFRVYLADRRTPTLQDVFDTVISTPAPYLDAVVTENHQADIYRQVARMDPMLSKLRVLTLKDLVGQSSRV